VPTVYLTEKYPHCILQVVQTGKVLRNSQQLVCQRLYVNDIEQEAVIAMNICLLN